MKKIRSSLAGISKNSALALAISFSCITTANSFSFGTPQTTSKRGEPLNSEIELINISEAERRDLKAAIGNESMYKNLNVERPRSNGDLLDISIQLVSEPQKTYLKITSTRPVTESFLDLAIEVNWATGRVFKDIGVLVTEEEKIAPVEKPLAFIEPIIGNNEKIIVTKGDTASDLAMRYIDKEVSLDQMLLALLKGNSEAFINDNVNLLKAGSELSMPTAEQSLAITPLEARQIIRSQNTSFNVYRAELAKRGAHDVIAKADTKASGRLEAHIEKKKSSAPKDTLTLGRASSKAKDSMIALDHERRELVKQSAEINKNIKELSQIVASAASSAGSGSALAEININTPQKQSPFEDANLSSIQTLIFGIGAFIFALFGFKYLKNRKQRNANLVNSADSTAHQET